MLFRSIWGMEGRNAYEEGNSTRSSHRGSTESYRVRCHRRIRSSQLASCMYMELKRSIEIATEPQTPIYTSAYTIDKMKTSNRKKNAFYLRDEILISPPHQHSTFNISILYSAKSWRLAEGGGRQGRIHNDKSSWCST